MTVAARQYVTLIVPSPFYPQRGRYLTLFFPQKKEEQWRFAGGKVEAGEVPIQAAARELNEELGLIASGLHLVHTNKPHWVDDALWQGHYFLVTASGTPRIMEPSKHSQLVYFTYDQLLQVGAFTAAEGVAVLEGRRHCA